MGDAVLHGLLPGELRAVVVVATEASREARARHQLAPASAALLGQGLSAGLLLAALQKDDSRVNLQLECDGPLRGLFVDAGADGEVRGYVKNPHVALELAGGAFRWRAALGNSGVLSVLRDIGVEYYRSSVALTELDLAADLDHYFATSDQVPTRVALGLRAVGDEALGVVAGALVQALPSGSATALQAAAGDLVARLDDALGRGLDDAQALFGALFADGQALGGETPVRFACTCSKERALQTLASLGPAEVQDIVDTMGSTAITCRFCGTKQEITLPDLLGLLEQLGAAGPRS